MVRLVLAASPHLKALLESTRDKKLLLLQLKKLRNEDTKLIRVFRDGPLLEYHKRSLELSSDLTLEMFLGLGMTKYTVYAGPFIRRFFCVCEGDDQGNEEKLAEYMAMLCETLKTQNKALNLARFYREVVPLSCATYIIGTLRRYIAWAAAPAGPT